MRTAGTSSFECNDFGNPVYPRCQYCNDRGACEEEMQIQLAREAPTIDVTPFLHSQRFDRLKVFAIGLLIGGAGVSVLQSSLGLPMATLMMAVCFGAGWVFGSDGKNAPKSRKPTTRRNSRGRW